MGESSGTVGHRPCHAAPGAAAGQDFCWRSTKPPQENGKRLRPHTWWLMNPPKSPQIPQRPKSPSNSGLAPSAALQKGTFHPKTQQKSRF